MHSKNFSVLLLTLTCVAVVHADEQGEWISEVGVQYRHFMDDIAAPQNPMAPQPDAWDNTASISFKTDYVRSFDNETKKLSFTPFVRIDQEDESRSHADIRELMWKHASGDMELNVGIGKVFWGVTEGQHLVDVINQNDLVEDIKGEEKLGQFMLRTNTRYESSALDFFFLTGFRERTLPGLDGRPGVSAALDEYTVEYESESKQMQPEFALRWSQRHDDLDWALSYFHGTNRDPIIIPGSLTTAPVVFYELMDQFSLDGSYLLGDWTLKLETLFRNADSEAFHAQVVGVEKTFSEFTAAPWEITLYLEYNRDSRDAAALQDDFFTGVRLALNDVDSSEIKLGHMQDVHNGSSSLRIEGSTRLGDDWKLGMLALYFDSREDGDSLSYYADDSYIQLGLFRYW